MNRLAIAAVVAVSLGIGTSVAVGQQSPTATSGSSSQGTSAGAGMGQGGMMRQGMQMHGPGLQTPAGRGFMSAMEKMQRDMNMSLTGNPDRDFAMIMIPHHQSAVEMAQVLVQNGRDPELRLLAEKMIRDQEREIEELRKIGARLPEK
jgi:uncharacterized protein (DUF305 family)